MIDGYHIPVMLNETIEALNVKKDGLYFDATLGGGGHSEAILKAGGSLIATDLDNDAITHGYERLKPYEGKFRLIRDNFKNFDRITEELGITSIDGAICDLGVSSHQLDTPNRGFAFRLNGKLDMRMDVTQPFNAKILVNEYSADEMAKIFFTFGEERYSRKIALNIVKQRQKAPIETTEELAEIIKRSVPYESKQQSATRCFQAIRIAVNGELDGLGEALEKIADKLKPNSRLCVISFHSLEDRIVKQTFKLLCTDCICDKSLPICVCGHKAVCKPVGKAIRPTKEEIKNNGRSESATLRIIEKK